ncbi:hypothetical protein PsYK624_050990 [Phanerochaete sordida]|uniref:Uncharacterized protein n=1 Tax=Phanerochaete sordida TaxID=48140 RepID=A0A9P3G7P5_9APHY|nr:hypothetical protein PsYK624_050990 [Phanerochaete sordida]
MSDPAKDQAQTNPAPATSPTEKAAEGDLPAGVTPLMMFNRSLVQYCPPPNCGGGCRRWPGYCC